MRRIHISLFWTLIFVNLISLFLKKTSESPSRHLRFSYSLNPFASGELVFGWYWVTGWYLWVSALKGLVWVKIAAWCGVSTQPAFEATRGTEPECRVIGECKLLSGLYRSWMASARCALIIHSLRCTASAVRTWACWRPALIASRIEPEKFKWDLVYVWSANR